jgi:O-antigen/teichoic acid export membrane protein
MSRYTLDLKFGKDIVLARLIDGIVSASDKLILAKMISIGDLGAYTRSQQFAMMPDANIRTPITTALLSYLAGNDSPLKTYLNMTWLIYAVAGFPCFLLISHGEKLLPLLLGEQWVEYGWMLRWLGIVGLAKVVQGIVVIVNINDKKAKYTIKLMAFSSVPSIFLPFLAFIVSDSFHVFLATMAFLLLIYWSCALIITLWSRYPDESLTLYINFLFIILSAIATMTAVDILGIQNVLFAALVEGAIFLGLLIIMKWRALLEIGKLF